MNLQRLTTPPLVVAHRGSTEHAVENTLPAFRDALADGAGAIELDVHLTLDRDLVVIHDDTLDRTYGRPGEVRTMTSAQLRDLGVPMLSDVLALPGEPKMIVEIKHPKGLHSEGVEQILLNQLHLAGAEDRTIVVSFDESSLKALHQIQPELPTGYLYSGRPIDPQQAKDDLGIDYLGPPGATLRSMCQNTASKLPKICHIPEVKAVAECSHPTPPQAPQRFTTPQRF